MKTEISSLQIMTNLVMADDLLSKAKKQLSEGKVGGDSDSFLFNMISMTR